jgi:hypothetical protein
MKNPADFLDAAEARSTPELGEPLRRRCYLQQREAPAGSSCSRNLHSAI